MSLTVLWLRYGSAVLEVLHYLGACARLDSWPGAGSNLRLQEAVSNVSALLRVSCPLLRAWHDPC